MSSTGRYEGDVLGPWEVVEACVDGIAREGGGSGVAVSSLWETARRAVHKRSPCLDSWPDGCTQSFLWRSLTRHADVSVKLASTDSADGSELATSARVVDWPEAYDSAVGRCKLLATPQRRARVLGLANVTVTEAEFRTVETVAGATDSHALSKASNLVAVGNIQAAGIVATLVKRRLLSKERVPLPSGDTSILMCTCDDLSTTCWDLLCQRLGKLLAESASDTLEVRRAGRSLRLTSFQTTALRDMIVHQSDAGIGVVVVLESQSSDTAGAQYFALRARVPAHVLAQKGNADRSCVDRQDVCDHLPSQKQLLKFLEQCGDRGALPSDMQFLIGLDHESLLVLLDSLEVLGRVTSRTAVEFGIHARRWFYRTSEAPTVHSTTSESVGAADDPVPLFEIVDDGAPERNPAAPSSVSDDSDAPPKKRARKPRKTAARRSSRKAHTWQHEEDDDAFKQRQSGQLPMHLSDTPSHRGLLATWLKRDDTELLARLCQHLVERGTTVPHWAAIGRAMWRKPHACASRAAAILQLDRIDDQLHAMIASYTRETELDSVVSRIASFRDVILSHSRALELDGMAIDHGECQLDVEQERAVALVLRAALAHGHATEADLRRMSSTYCEEDVSRAVEFLKRRQILLVPASFNTHSMKSPAHLTLAAVQPSRDFWRRLGEVYASLPSLNALRAPPEPDEEGNDDSLYDVTVRLNGPCHTVPGSIEGDQRTVVAAAWNLSSGDKELLPVVAPAELRIDEDFITSEAALDPRFDPSKAAASMDLIKGASVRSQLDAVAAARRQCAHAFGKPALDSFAEPPKAAEGTRQSREVYYDPDLAVELIDSDSRRDCSVSSTSTLRPADDAAVPNYFRSITTGTVLHRRYRVFLATVLAGVYCNPGIRSKDIVQLLGYTLTEEHVRYLCKKLMEAGAISCRTSRQRGVAEQDHFVASPMALKVVDVSLLLHDILL